MSKVRELGPPDRKAADKAAGAKPRRESVVAPLVIVSADTRSAAKRRGSIFSLIAPGAALTEARTDHRPPPNGPDNPRRPSCVVQPEAVQVPGKQRRKTAAVQAPMFLSVEVSIDDGAKKKVAPLADEIVKRLSGSKDQPADSLLPFGDSDNLLGDGVGDHVPAALSTPAAMSISISSRNGRLTTSSQYSVRSTDSEYRHSGVWRLRWSLDKVGRQAGQIRCVRDICLLRGGANLVATESKNGRLQLFSCKAGRSLAVLGPESESGRTARSFGSYANVRKMQPTGVTETAIDNLVAVTDLNRILYVGAGPDGELETEVVLKGKTTLSGIAATQNSKLIVSEIGSQASVGVYETTGKLVHEYNGDFRSPCYLAFDPDYNLCAVSDGELRFVGLYDSSGRRIARLGAALGSAAAELAYPSGVCWIGQGRLLVADQVQNRMVLFDLRNLCAETLLSARDELSHPVAVAADFGASRQRIFVTEESYDFGVNRYVLKMFERRQ